MTKTSVNAIELVNGSNDATLASPLTGNHVVFRKSRGRLNAMPQKKLKLVSGGQTGAHRAAPDFAIKHGIPYDGWCPKGRLAEDGQVPARYRLKETSTSVYSERTELNVRDSDGTVVLTISPKLSGGSLETFLFAKKQSKPVLHLFRHGSTSPGNELRRFVQEQKIQILDVAGRRASNEPAVGACVKEVLETALAAA